MWQCKHHDMLLILYKILTQCSDKESTQKIQSDEKKTHKNSLYVSARYVFYNPIHTIQNLKCAKNTQRHYHI